MRDYLRKPEVLILLVSSWIALTCNTGYWQVVAASDTAGTLPTPVYFFSVAILTIGLINLVMLILAFGRLTRPVLAVALVIGSATGYFTARFGILFDPGMLINVFETNTAEASELFSPALMFSVSLLGLLPAIVVWHYPLVRRRIHVAFLERGVAFAVAFALIAGPLLLSQKEIFSLARNHREIRHMIAPVNVISASVVLLRDQLESPAEFQSVALDAVHPQPDGVNAVPEVHVLIIGETARAANFSLDGYLRDTNPELQQHTDINFVRASSCGTATAISLPCMFSLVEHDEFDRDESRNQENLLDIASRAGYDVYWIDNGNGCKGICARVDYRDLHLSDVATICPDKECYDEILVHELTRMLPNIRKDTLIVLHQLGSHGPAYYRRYPENYRTFYPDCRSPNLGDCTNEEIANAYDNTIVYTDHVISSAIDALSAESGRIDASLIYVSDHGESLGEHNLYLHGMPYKFAPDEQTQIPLISWFSPGAEQSQGLDSKCPGSPHRPTVSHDNLFHTELGLLGIQTAVYDPELDLYSSCRAGSRMAATVDTAANRT